MSLEKVVASLKRNNNFLITTHTNMEGDALGSVLAIAKIAHKLGKRANIITESHIPYGYEFMPGAKNIKRFKPSLANFKYDCMVILDCSDLERSGDVAKIKRSDKPIINIDHHVSNSNFGDVNWVDPSASSCTNMIYTLYKRLGFSFDKEIATLLYVGILTDTGSFRYTNTNSFTHQAVAELLKYGLDVAKIYRNIYGSIPFEDMKLLADILPEIKLVNEGKIVWFQIKGKQLRNRQLSFDLSEQILTFGRSVKGAEVVVLFKESPDRKNEIRANLRSQGKFDVNKLACYFGGGGHRTASGFTAKGTLNQVVTKTLKKIRERL